MYPRSIARRLDTSARRPQSRAVLRATRDLVLPTTITGSYPRPQWFVEELRGRGFKDALGDSRFREQYLDAVACLVREQEMAGLDIVTDGDSRFDLTVGGKSWFFYVIERLRGITGHVDRAAAGGCRVIPVEKPQHHIAGANGTATDKDLEFFTEAVNREIAGVDTEIWLHTCWGNPNQQPLHWDRPSYERALPYLLATNADVLTLECASTKGRDLPLLKHHRTDKKIAIGVVNHSTAAVEPPEFVANLIRRALEYVPPERLVLS